MLQVLLVDDEPFILRGLRELIDWREQGFLVAGTAQNGLEALDFLEHNAVDLVLSDIRMPGMSGLELLEKVRDEKKSKAYFAILSGYNDFEYARRAMYNACVDYLLKPVQKEELYALLQRVREMREDDNRRAYETSRQEKAYFTRNLIALLCGKYDGTNLEEVRKHLSLSGGLRYVGIELYRGTETEEQMRSRQRELYEVCLGLLGGYGYHCIFDVSRSESRYDLGLVYCDEMAQAAGMKEQEWLDGLLEKLQRTVGLPVNMLVGCRVERLEEISESYRTAAMARSFREFGMGGAESGEAGTEVLCKRALDELAEAIEHNDRAAISGSVAQVYEELNRKGMDARLVDINIHYLLFRLVHLATQQDETVNQEEILRFIGSGAFGEGAAGGSRAQLSRFAGEYADYLVQLRGKSARGVLGEIEREVRENFSQNLTLKELSRKYFVNSAYLGQLFRKKYGQPFKDYLNQYRIGRAAELLVHSDMKIYEVAERCGYRDLDYFINRFIEEKGCTPARFRRQSREEN
ncbi:MAG: response regulator [Eubacteriales bacterium]|nr:response regulator [Eubacteriales bacterium]